MYIPLVILAIFAVGVGWPLPGLSVEAILEQARPAGPIGDGVLLGLHYPDEHASHNYHNLATIVAFSTALAGFVLATLFYGVNVLSAEEARRQFRPIYNFLWHKWYFDELYNVVFVQHSVELHDGARALVGRAAELATTLLAAARDVSRVERAGRKASGGERTAE